MVSFTTDPYARLTQRLQQSADEITAKIIKTQGNELHKFVTQLDTLGMHLHAVLNEIEKREAPFGAVVLTPMQLLALCGGLVVFAAKLSEPQVKA